jgi:hypothetical protein
MTRKEMLRPPVARKEAAMTEKAKLDPLDMRCVHPEISEMRWSLYLYTGTCSVTDTSWQSGMIGDLSRTYHLLPKCARRIFREWLAFVVGDEAELPACDCPEPWKENER